MTSRSLYFKLLKEDFRRRLWAIALVFLAFFFTLPIGLALETKTLGGRFFPAHILLCNADGGGHGDREHRKRV